MTRQTYVDLNAPDITPGIEYITLWKNVVIRLLRDSCESRRKLTQNIHWATTASCREVCEMAQVDRRKLQLLLVSIYQSEDARMKLLKSLICYKSRIKSFTETGNIPKSKTKGIPYVDDF